ncbi:MAG: 3-phosphoshikimate 1-carboxyvinyltransferase [Marinilabiliales bacterium]|nr:MAG: 3-phosphoshikimate 1-carboxyvinyltransferase [Marinilabiliales bacterium]
MNLKITSPNKEIKSFMSLPASKSISNRALIIKALCEKKFKIKNLSESNDTKVLTLALKDLSKQSFNIGAAGTAMRFLTAFFAITPGERILTGSERMKKRPIFELVNILNDLGANIEYAEKEGFPPLTINGQNLTSKPVKIKGNISSQYISALLMIAPHLNKKFELEIEGKILSKDYIWMTIHLMREFGINIEWNQNKILVEKGTYQHKELIVEGDWSSASYWFEIISLCNDSMIELTGLKKNSLQGDSVLPKLFKDIGVNSAFTNFGVRIKNVATSCKFFEYDFTDCPDLAQTIAVTLVAKNIPFKLTGLDNLSIKETDRIKALVTEFEKLGIHLNSNKTAIFWDGDESVKAPENHIVKTYEDHRMALAFAPLSIITKELEIENPDVVAKSYPDYWKNLERVGFKTRYK